MRRRPNNLRLVARLSVGLPIQVEIQCLRVVSGTKLCSKYNINGGDVQRKNVVNNVDKSSLWAP